MKPRVLVFLPTYNEAGNIGKLLDQLLALECEPDVLVIDDQSPDGTGKIASERAAADRRIHVVMRPAPRGRGLAGRDGFRWFQAHPEYDVLIEMDADFSHQPKFIPAMIRKIAEVGADVVVGSRFVKGGGETGRPPSRVWITRLANTYLRFVLRTRLGDCTTGFRAFTQRALAGIDFTRYRSEGPTIVTELLYDLIRRRRRIAEVPILFEERIWGTSKLSGGILVRSVLYPLRLRFG
ncbi:MAG: polyprenol monophosphomannose synthase, partial [Candidatus Riflebacteria bacterium]|nr:polyprenol monophosphomannose synthase [Candidatus Riflebacteria bacterium]